MLRMICPNTECICHRRITEDFFCYLCGSKNVAVDGKCECGKLLHPIDRFCGECGKQVER